MPLALPSGFSESTLSPFIGFAIKFGVGAMSLAAPKSILLVGNIIKTALSRTVGTETYITAAGTLALNTRTFCASPDEALTYGGAGSPLHLMAKQVFAQNRRASVYLLAVDTNGSATKATATLLFAGPATTAGTVNLYLGGEKIEEIAFSSGNTAAAVAEAVAHAVNKKSDWPVTATFATATTTLTAKVGGPRGNDIPFKIVVTGSGITVAINGGSAGSGGAAFVGGVTAGAGVDDITTALASVAATRNALIAIEASDEGNITALRSHVNTYAALTERRRQQGFVGCTNKTVSEARDIAENQNAPRIRLAYHRAVAPSGSVVDQNIRSAGEIAAAFAAGALYGDGAVGGGVGTSRGELAYPAANLDGTMLAAIFDHANDGTRLTATEIESLLQSGVTPLVGSVKNPGYTAIVKSVTTRSKDGSGNPDYKVHDSSKVTVADYLADRLEKTVADEYPNKNIAPEPATPRPPPHPDVIFPSMARDTVLRDLYAMENNEGLLVNVKQLESSVVVEQSQNNPTLLVGSIPFDVIDHFHSMVGEVLQVG